MTRAEARRYPHGVYRLFWKEGGHSVAAVGSLYNGSRWFAPSNWTSQDEARIPSCNWRKIDRVELIEVQP